MGIAHQNILNNLNDKPTMTIIYQCQIELHDRLYYATREIGRLYETESILHNYSLCYALGFVDSEKYQTTVDGEDAYTYFCAEQIPKYQQHLTPLNQQNIYLTPAKSIKHHTTLTTWKYANNNYHVEMQKTQTNIPSFGRNKEIAEESIFDFFIISEKHLQIPHWIRLGKWMSKAEVSKVKEIVNPKTTTGVFTCPHPLNPLDVMFTNRLISYDVINMPPVSLIRNVTMEGKYYQGFNLPVNMNFQFQP